MRLFIAVAADEEVKAAAAEAVARLRRAGGSFRWVDPRDMHVTLRYFGPTPEEKLPEVIAIMKAAAAKTKPFELVYSAVSAFDTPQESRVVWLGVSEGKEPLEAAAALVGRDEPRPYTPHMTLGRNRQASAPPEFVAALAAEPVLELRRPVAKLSLYASKPAPFGHAYEILEEADLTG
ncbi:MAG: RNA 2',3'-cyclic phosphodiesterase [Elusimicrobiota bacterium]|nr:MAG: RNA 2',3'-cyclic phosphodiesterase [Elusimicrobiota bacterium]